MRFYQLEFRAKADEKIDPTGALVGTYTREWFGAERDAVRRRLNLFGAGLLTGRKCDHPIWPVDVPTTKPELLTFLRKEAV